MRKVYVIPHRSLFLPWLYTSRVYFTIGSVRNMKELAVRDGLKWYGNTAAMWINGKRKKEENYESTWSGMACGWVYVRVHASKFPTVHALSGIIFNHSIVHPNTRVRISRQCDYPVIGFTFDFHLFSCRYAAFVSFHIADSAKRCQYSFFFLVLF